MFKPTLVLVRGVPGSGKSSFVKLDEQQRISFVKDFLNG